MIKKDFELIARAIRDARPITKADAVDDIRGKFAISGANSALDNVAGFLAEELAARYPRFNRAKFLEACKLPT